MGQMLQPDDRVRFEDEIWTVTAVGAAVRLVSEAGPTQLVMLSTLLGSDGFELLDSADPAPRLEPVSLLESLPADVVARAASGNGT